MKNQYRVWRTFYAFAPCGVTHDTRWFGIKSRAMADAMSVTHCGDLKIREVRVERRSPIGDFVQVAQFSKHDLMRLQK